MTLVVVVIAQGRSIGSVASGQAQPLHTDPPPTAFLPNDWRLIGMQGTETPDRIYSIAGIWGYTGPAVASASGSAS